MTGCTVFLILRGPAIDYRVYCILNAERLISSRESCWSFHKTSKVPKGPKENKFPCIPISFLRGRCSIMAKVLTWGNPFRATLSPCASGSALWLLLPIVPHVSAGTCSSVSTSEVAAWRPQQNISRQKCCVYIKGIICFRWVTTTPVCYHIELWLLYLFRFIWVLNRWGSYVKENNVQCQEKCLKWGFSYGSGCILE